MAAQKNPKADKDISKFIVSVDCVIFGYIHNAIYVPLLMRAIEPYKDCWSLPGGPIYGDESPEQACLRKLEEDIGLKIEYIEQLYTFAAANRDPRERAFSISHFALIEETDRPLIWGQDSRTAQWFQIDKLPEGNWAFDHEDIVQTAIKRLRGKLTYEPIGLSLLPDEFSLPELKKIYDVILGIELDRRNFYKKIKSKDLLIPTSIVPSNRGKPTQLYRFDRKRYAKLKEEGFSFSY